MTQINSKYVSKWINNKGVQIYKCHTIHVFSLPYYCVWIVLNKWDKCGGYSHELSLLGFLSIMSPKWYSKWRETLVNKSFFFFLVEQVVKPKENKTENENTTDKPKRKKKGHKGRKNRKNKKKNPCDTKFQNFCIHGECKYIEHLKAVTCK